MMVATNDLLIGVYYRTKHAKKVVEALRDRGFQEEQLRVTLCEAGTVELPAAARPALVVVTILLGALLAGGVGALLGAWFQQALAIIWLGALVGAAVGAPLGRWVALAVLFRARSSPSSRGVVAVRPDGRQEEATAILQRYSSCDTSAISS